MKYNLTRPNRTGFSVVIVHCLSIVSVNKYGFRHAVYLNVLSSVFNLLAPKYNILVSSCRHVILIMCMHYLTTNIKLCKMNDLSYCCSEFKLTAL